MNRKGTVSQNTITPKATNAPTATKEKNIAQVKNVVCFKGYGHEHFRNECPNASAFTLQEWKKIQYKIRSKAMLINRNGREEVILPSTTANDLEWSYCVNDLGLLERME